MSLKWLFDQTAFAIATGFIMGSAGRDFLEWQYLLPAVIFVIVGNIVGPRDRKTGRRLR